MAILVSWSRHYSRRLAALEHYIYFHENFLHFSLLAFTNSHSTGTCLALPLNEKTDAISLCRRTEQRKWQDAGLGAVIVHEHKAHSTFFLLFFSTFLYAIMYIARQSSFLTTEFHTSSVMFFWIGFPKLPITTPRGIILISIHEIIFRFRNLSNCHASFLLSDSDRKSIKVLAFVCGKDGREFTIFFGKSRGWQNVKGAFSLEKDKTA